MVIASSRGSLSPSTWTLGTLQRTHMRTRGCAYIQGTLGTTYRQDHTVPHTSILYVEVILMFLRLCSNKHVGGIGGLLVVKLGFNDGSIGLRVSVHLTYRVEEVTCMISRGGGHSSASHSAASECYTVPYKKCDVGELTY